MKTWFNGRVGYFKSKSIELSVGIRREWASDLYEGSSCYGPTTLIIYLWHWRFIIGGVEEEPTVVEKNS